MYVFKLRYALHKGILDPTGSSCKISFHVLQLCPSDKIHVIRMCTKHGHPRTDRYVDI